MQQPKILVAIRKRPLSKKEAGKGDSDIITVKNQETVIVSQYKQKVDLTKYLQQTVFNFDFAFNEETNNEDIYDRAVRPLVDSAFQGAKVTCFAYGQTGSGKTFTMNGVPSQGLNGLYTLGAQDIFYYLSDPRFSHLKARLSFFEIYCGKLFDLLNKRQQLKIREDNKSNINIIGIEQVHITSTQQFMELLNYGASQRVTSQNSANADSSRSHAILQIQLKDGKKLFGKISFIDLAGNQRGADHMDMNKQTRIDGAQINKSLLSLKECIRALDQGKSHTPFRGSKLTMVLKDSFVGFCRTVMIGNISPSSASSENTLNTLRYADRVKQLRKPQQQVISKQDKKAKQLMLPRNNKNAIKIQIDKDDDAQDIMKKRQDAQKQFGLIDRQQKNFPQSSILGKVTSNKQPNKQQSTSNNATKINMTNNRKAPIIGNYQQQPSDRDRTVKQIKVPTNIQKAYSNQVNSNKMQIENTSYQSNNKYYQPQQPISNQRQSNNGGSNYNINNSNIGIDSPLRPHEKQYSPYPQPSYPQQNNFIQSQHPNSLKNIPISQPSQLTKQQPQNLFSNTRQMVAQQQFQIPNTWQETIQQISTTQNPLYLQKLQQSISENLLIQQSNLMQSHSNTLRKQIDIIKQQMSLINKFEMDRNAISTRQYISFLRQSIEEKLSALQYLRQNLIQFQYKMDQVQEIQQKVKHLNGHQRGQDEQLLDDLNF